MLLDKSESDYLSYRFQAYAIYSSTKQRMNESLKCVTVVVNILLGLGSTTSELRKSRIFL